MKLSRFKPKDLSFAYEDRTVLHDASVVIPQGKITALVGPNGSGESTLVMLLDRLYPAKSGELLLGNAKASEVSLKVWHEQFALISQSPSLFSGSLRDNICYGVRWDLSEEEILQAAHLTNLDEALASHEGGLDYKIGIKGRGLSGGEQQRVAIARAAEGRRDPDSRLNEDPLRRALR